MGFDPQLTPKKQIRNLLMILGAGLFGGILLSLFMLYRYGPEGHYLLKNALLSPEVIAQISAPKNGKLKHFSQTNIDKIEYSYQDLETKKRTVIPVDKTNYTSFYQKIADDKSLLEIPPEVMSAFTQMPESSLNLIVKDSSNDSSHQIFQEVQFLYKGDYYRLQLRDSKTSHWIYFYHPHIYEEAFHQFTSTKS